MNLPIRTAIIGAGVQGIAHAQQLALMPNVELVAVADISIDRAGELCAAHGGVAYADYTEMLAASSPELVLVVVPTFCHRPAVVAALEAGAHVLCEKPVALNADEARQMYQAAHDAERLLTFGFNMRFLDSVAAIKQAIDAGELGRIHHVRAWVAEKEFAGYGAFNTKAESGGGILSWCGVHILDVAMWLMAYPQPLQVMGSCYNRSLENPAIKETSAGHLDVIEVEDLVAGHILLADNKSLSIENAVSVDHPKDDLGVHVFGTHGTARFSVDSCRIGDGDRADIAAWDWPRSQGEEVRQFIRAIRDGAAMPVAEEEAIMNQAIVDAFYRSAEAGKSVAVE